MNSHSICIGSSLYHDVSDFPSEDELTLYYQDLRGFDFSLGPWKKVCLNFCLLDNVRFSKHTHIDLQGCWILNPQLLPQFFAAHLGKMGNKATSKVNSNERVWELHQKVLSSEGLDINPAMENFHKKVRSLPFSEMVALYIPLLFAQDEITARNAFAYMSTEFQFKNKDQKNYIFLTFLLSLLTHSYLYMEYEFLESFYLEYPRLMGTGVRGSLKRLYSKGRGEVLTALIFMKNMKNSPCFSLADFYFRTPRLAKLLLSSDENVSSMSLYHLKKIYSDNILNWRKVRKMEKEVLFYLDALEKSNYNHHKIILSEIKSFFQI